MGFKYRVRLRLFGFEPQMFYQAGQTGKWFWMPLDRAGYWLEPGAFSSGVVTKRSVMSFNDARLALRRARMINEGGRVVRQV
jgi:hypothetical protein